MVLQKAESRRAKSTALPLRHGRQARVHEQKVEQRSSRGSAVAHRALTRRERS